ncbi:MAG: soluble NSF attachment family protein, partial [Gammaproteobacteria bacterium]|nr:soluble NSF attachment family protein [Gammaproteobacteria bacterium]NNJ84489.1 tetratricopeptide repeat protein [Gammaproteobacteria bacterium]
LDEAIGMHEKAVAIYERIGNEPNAAQVYGNLAICYKQKGDVARALEYYRQSLAITERIGDRHTSANQYFNLGTLYRDEIGDKTEARTNLEKAKALFEQVGDAPHAQDAAQALKEL